MTEMFVNLSCYGMLVGAVLQIIFDLFALASHEP